MSCRKHNLLYLVNCLHNCQQKSTGIVETSAIRARSIYLMFTTSTWTSSRMSGSAFGSTIVYVDSITINCILILTNWCTYIFRHFIPESFKEYDYLLDSEKSLSSHFEKFFKPATNRPSIIYIHGSDRDRSATGRVELCQKLSEMGYHVFAIDFRGNSDLCLSNPFFFLFLT